jgi:hypothetical protein
MFAHVPFAPHGVPIMHSLMSVQPVPPGPERPLPAKPAGQLHVNVDPPVGLHVAAATQVSTPAAHASVTLHVSVVPGHETPDDIVPVGHMQLYQPVVFMQVPRPQRPGVHSLSSLHVPPVAGLL